MNYYNHTLRTDIQEWKNRLHRATFKDYGNQLKFLFAKFEKVNKIRGILNEACLEYPVSDEQLSDYLGSMRRGGEITYKDECDQAAFCYQLVKYFVKKVDTYNIFNYNTFGGKDYNDRKQKFLNQYITPILNFLHDSLDKSSSIIFLLEKYKRRVEWFTRSELYQQYTNATKNYEQIFEDDLRLFLFDQGIDYPFSTPHSASGRADIVGEINTNDPLIVEIKIFDKEKNYGKDRIRDGFHQIVKYTNDYNKNIGYLVIFNLDEFELEYNFSDSKNVFPPSIVFNNKTYYFVTIDTKVQKSASKLGTIKKIVISEDELTKNG